MPPADCFETIQLFGMQISQVSMTQAVDTLVNWCKSPRTEACRYVVTPNVDHAVMFQEQAEFRAAYEQASLVLADGLPLVISARALGRNLPERVAGSDVVPAVFSATPKPLRVFLLGAAPGVAELAASRIHEQWPNVRVVGTYSPPLGFERNATENSRTIAAVNAVEHDLLIVGFGAPRQEIWVNAHRHDLSGKVAICGGATIDFLAGHRRRSPVWMRRLGLEWLHRVGTEPRRLAGRYARDAWIFPRLLWHEWQHTPV